MGSPLAPGLERGTGRSGCRGSQGSTYLDMCGLRESEWRMCVNLPNHLGTKWANEVVSGLLGRVLKPKPTPFLKVVV